MRDEGESLNLQKGEANRRGVVWVAEQFAEQRRFAEIRWSPYGGESIEANR
jgi:hypothetical protein